MKKILTEDNKAKTKSYFLKSKYRMDLSMLHRTHGENGLTETDTSEREKLVLQWPGTLRPMGSGGDLGMLVCQTKLT